MKTTQIQIKTKNQIFHDFITLVKSALSTFGAEKWEVQQLNQIFKINILKDTVFISIISSSQNGRQYYKKAKIERTIRRTNSVKQEVQIRFSATRREKQTDTLETYAATDILKLIKSYMQTPEGIQQLAEMGYAQYRATEVSEQNFMNDSDNFQFLPYFECTFLFTETWANTIGEITKVTGNIHKV